MAINDIVQTIAEARVDARSLSEFVFKPAGFKVARRLAPTVDTLQFYINRFNSLNGDFSSSVSVALSSLNNSVAEAEGKVAYIETTVQDAINNTAVEGGVLADTFITVNNSINQRQINMGFDNNTDIVAITNANIGMRVYSKIHASHFVFKETPTSPVNDGTVLQGIGGVWEMELMDAYHASWFATPNVQEDQSENLQKGYSYAASVGRSFIIDGDYYVKESNKNTEMATFNDPASYTAINIISNSAIHFRENSSLRLLASNKENYNLLLFFNVENVIVTRPRVFGDLGAHIGSTGEYGYGITVHSSENIFIQRPEINNMWGDGLYVGLAYGSPDTLRDNNNVLVEYPIIDRVRRNGISLTSGDGIRIIKPIIKNVYGRAPQAAIDIEPEEKEGAGYKKAVIKNCVIDAPHIIDCLNAVMINIFGVQEIDLKFMGTTIIEVTQAAAIQPAGITLSTRYKSASAIDIPEQKGLIYFENVVYKASADTAKIVIAAITDFTSSGIPIVFNSLESQLPSDFGWTLGNLNSQLVNKRTGVVVNNLVLKEGRKLIITHPSIETKFDHIINLADNVEVQTNGNVPANIVFTEKSHVGGFQRVAAYDGYQSKHFLQRVVFAPLTGGGTGFRIVRVNEDTRKLEFRVESKESGTTDKLVLVGVNYKGKTTLTTATSDAAIALKNNSGHTNTEIYSLYGVWDTEDAPRIKGTTLQRPATAKVGQVYYDTTLLAAGKPISWNGTSWVDALGATV